MNHRSGPDETSGALAAVAGSMIALELSLGLFLPASFLGYREIPWGARLLVLAYSMGLLILSVGAVGKLALLCHRLMRAAALKLLGKAAIGLLLFLYVLSWATFWQVGKFLNWDSLRFWITQPLQVFHWIDIDVGLLVIAATVIFACTILRWLPRWSRRWNGATQAKVVKAVKVLLILCLFWIPFGEIYAHRGEQTYLRSIMLYQRARDEMSTPLAHLIGRLRAAIAGGADHVPLLDGSALVQRRIVPLHEYVAGIDRAKLRPWNVVVIVVESLRADQVGVPGRQREVMPAVAALARDSRVFTNTRSHSSQTSYAVLTPLSSHHPLRSNAQYAYPENPSYPRVLTYDVLKKLGYRTGAFSSSNENWEGMIHYLRTENLDFLFHASVFKGPTYVAPGDTFFGNWVMATRHAGSVDDRFTVDAAIKWLSESPEKPFFMYVNLQNSHVPYRIPDGFARRFSREPANFTLRFGHFPRDKVDAVKDLYADSLAYVDAQIDRLFEHLREQKLWDRTLVVITGDHGQAFYEHGFAAHGGPIFDEVMKVPLIVRAPGLKAAIDDRPAQHIDIPPLIFDLLGLPAHPSFQGQSLMAADSERDKSIFMVAQTPLAYQYGIVRSGWKLIYDERSRTYSLFNLSKDPRETVDLAAEQAPLVKRLADRLHTWRAAQIGYYQDPKWHTREYPPVVKD